VCANGGGLMAALYCSEDRNEEDQEEDRFAAAV